VALGVGVVFTQKATWITRQWNQTGDGHFVNKLVVCLLFVHVFNFVRWTRELMTMGKFILAKYQPELYGLLVKIMLGLPMHVLKVKFKKQSCVSNYEFNYLKVPLIPLAVFVATTVWDNVWITYVCKSQRDRSCTKSGIGLMLYNYRNQVHMSNLCRTKYNGKIILSIYRFVMMGQHRMQCVTRFFLFFR
jgi:hypothetical protein